jgi:UDP-N-acetylglucosamine acyltransferase
MSKAFIHPTALVSEKAKIGSGVKIGAYSCIGEGVSLADHVEIGAHVVIEAQTSVGEGTKIFPFVAIGSAPQFVGHKKETSKITIGKQTQIREHVTIHFGTEKEGTSVGDNCTIMVASHIAHDCHVGNGVWMANNATLGGHVVVEDNVIIGGLSGIHQNVRLGRGSIIGGLSGVEGDVIPYGSVMGNRARLCGLNLVGLRRRGADRERIHALRSAYRLLFADEGTLNERIQDAIGIFKENEVVMEIVNFLKKSSDKSSRPLCLPR